MYRNLHWILNHGAKTAEELKRCGQASCLITYSLKLHEIN